MSGNFLTFGGLSLRYIKRSYTYKSIYNVANLYPNSVNAFTHPAALSNDSSREKFTGEVPLDKVKQKYSRSSGSGGQHVNKTNTKVEMRFHVMSADWLPENVKLGLVEKYAKRISREGELIVSAGNSRYQLNNTKECVDQIKAMIDEVQKPPDTRKQDIQDTLNNMDSIQAAHKRRLKQKKMRSYTKQMRNTYNFHED